MRRHRIRIVLFCLLALVWCQLSAAAQLCGSDASTDAASTVATESLPCHAGDPAADPCMSTHCPAGQALKDPSTLDFAFVIAPLVEQFPLVLALGPALPAGPCDAAVRSTGPPPHFLGRLLI